MSASPEICPNAAAARRVPPSIAVARVLRARRLGRRYFAARARELGLPLTRLPRGVPSLRDVGRGCVVHGLHFDDQLTPHYDEWMLASGFLYRWLAEQDMRLPGEDTRGAWYPYRME